MIWTIRSYGSGSVVFGPEETKINGSIKYSVIGKYIAHFNKFKGRIGINEKTNIVESVYLEIDTATIESDCRWCDRIVRSPQLLAAEKYPKIIFTSQKIIKDKADWKVMGFLEMHGVKSEVVFPFQVKILTNASSQEKILNVSGHWEINRKDFNIIWNKLLDHGGVLVGDYINVDWGIKTGIKYQSEEL